MDVNMPRRSIPRPWLSQRPVTGEEFRYGRTTNNNVIFAQTHTDIADVWDKPTWNVSWNKLTSCFCVRKQQQQEPAKILEHSTYNNGSFYLQPKYQMNMGEDFDGTPYANHPGRLTNSMRSCSWGSHNRGAASWANGSMSSFSLSDSDSTVSESSSSYSSSNNMQLQSSQRKSHARSSSLALTDTSHDLSGSVQLHTQVVADPPPPPPTHNGPSNNINSGSGAHPGKPPMISQRHTSLPPRMSVSSAVSPPRGSSNVPGRSRCDTGDYSKSSALTNNSRHRRLNQHFSFCDDSMDNILDKKHQRGNSFCLGDDQSSTGVPLSMIMCPERRRPPLERDHSGYISPMEDEYDDSDDDASLNMSGFDFDISKDELGDADSIDDWRNDDDSYSPFANLSRKVPSKDWMQDWAASGKNTLSPKKDLSGQITVDHQSAVHVVTPHTDEIVETIYSPKRSDSKGGGDDTESAPVYLRKNQDVDVLFGNRLAISGWVAVTFGEDSMVDRLKRSSPLSPNDMYYLCATEEVDSSVVLFFSDEHGNVLHTLHCEQGWRCESREISGQVGRCVTLRDEGGATLASLLPVSLPDCFFTPTSGNLVSEQKFKRLRDRLFAMAEGASSDQRVYAPDEQHDSAMHIMFSLDALLNKIRRLY